MDVLITSKAKAKLHEQDVGLDPFLRIGVEAGGCSGMTYSASAGREMRDGDEVIYQDDELKVVADERSALFLDGLRIDFSDDLVKSGFRLSNPNAKRSCGCGASFTA